MEFSVSGSAQECVEEFLVVFTEGGAHMCVEGDSGDGDIDFCFGDGAEGGDFAGCFDVCARGCAAGDFANIEGVGIEFEGCFEVCELVWEIAVGGDAVVEVHEARGDDIGSVFGAGEFEVEGDLCGGVGEDFELFADELGYVAEAFDIVGELDPANVDFACEWGVRVKFLGVEGGGRGDLVELTGEFCVDSGGIDSECAVDIGHVPAGERGLFDWELEFDTLKLHEHVEVSVACDGQVGGEDFSLEPEASVEVSQA